MKSGRLYGLFVVLLLLAVSSGNGDTGRVSASVQSCQQSVNHESIISTAGFSAEKLLPSFIFLKVLGNASETAHTYFSTATIRQFQAKFTLKRPQRKKPHTVIQFYSSETDDTHHLA